MSSSLFAFDGVEHRLLSDSVFESMLSETGAVNKHNSILIPFGQNEIIIPRDFDGLGTFGKLVAEFAADDQKQHRFHRRAESILKQIRRIEPEELEKCLSTAISWSKEENSDLRLPNIETLHSDNVIGTYLIHHLAALRIAALMDVTDSQQLSKALVWEAIAQGYLADCFSSGHMILPVHHFISELQKKDRRDADRHHSLTGIFVINAAGDVWQAFGDGALLWYQPSYQHLFEACQSSLREIFLVFYQTRGVAPPDRLSSWFDKVSPDISLAKAIDTWLKVQQLDSLYDTPAAPTLLPTLQYLPVPVVAAWSTDSEEIVIDDFHKRKYYPQLNELSGRDTSLYGIENDFLLSRDDFPDWMVAPPLKDSLDANPQQLIKEDVHWASVAYVQSLSPIISFEGLTFDFGTSWLIDHGEIAPSIGLGYGFHDDLFLIRNLGVGLRFYPKSSSSASSALSTFGAIRLINPVQKSLLKIFETIGGEAGVVSELEDGGNFGMNLAVSLRSKPHSFRSMHLGLSFEFAYEIFTFFSPTRNIHQFSARLVLN
ncbi:MAG: hypothetical protein IH914_06650 [candidate division Zixibacteria bacterium]|nr:hypothetical protein [candidate division Zixibacteria bacterium]